MAYKNIVFVKLEKRLLNDHRWYMMSEPAQLIYIKLILLAAETYNKIPKNDIILKEALRSRQDLKVFQECLKEIRKNYPKLKENKHFYYFDEFEHKTNFIPNRELLGKSPVISQHKAEQDKDKEEDIDKEQDKDMVFVLDLFHKKQIALPKEVLESVKKSFYKNHTHINNPRGWIYSAFKKQWADYNAQKNIVDSVELNKLSECKEIMTLIGNIGK